MSEADVFDLEAKALADANISKAIATVREIAAECPDGCPHAVQLLDIAEGLKTLIDKIPAVDYPVPKPEFIRENSTGVLAEITALTYNYAGLTKELAGVINAALTLAIEHASVHVTSKPVFYRVDLLNKVQEANAILMGQMRACMDIQARLLPMVKVAKEMSRRESDAWAEKHPDSWSESEHR